MLACIMITSSKAQAAWQATLCYHEGFKNMQATTTPHPKGEFGAPQT